MSTLRDLAEEHTGLGPPDIDHLTRLAGDWQLLSDLSFADLTLWVVTEVPDPAATGRTEAVDTGETLVCVAQVRPTTIATVHPDDLVTLVSRALSPAKVSSVTITGEGEERSALVVVPDSQLSLAIGKKGQNARLAAKLTGLRVDVKSETELAEERRRPEAFLAGCRSGEVVCPGAAGVRRTRVTLPPACSTSR